jgi:hypothetical protein
MRPRPAAFLDDYWEKIAAKCIDMNQRREPGWLRERNYVRVAR